MIPAALKAEHFAGYPPEARALATRYVSLLQALPLAFLPLLLRELIEYDWQFPPERKSMERQLAWLGAMPAAERQRFLAAFAGLRLSAGIEQVDWVGTPALFSEQLTAWLWSSGQLDGFRAAAIAYVDRFESAAVKEPPALSRLGIAVVGQGASAGGRPLFRKLRPKGVYFSGIDPENGFGMILEAVMRRAVAAPLPSAHWYIDGGAGEKIAGGVSCVSYQSLAPARARLLERIRIDAQSGTMGPEAVVAAFARIRPGDLGLNGGTALDQFQARLLTQGSGTQIFSTTFVQWAAREAWRRAQPLTLLARFSPRQRERPMNELLTGGSDAGTDPQGSLVDADMGAYYTWLNQQRLADAGNASFLVWFEGHSEAVGIGPSLSGGGESAERFTLAQLLNKVAPAA